MEVALQSQVRSKWSGITNKPHKKFGKTHSSYNIVYTIYGAILKVDITPILPGATANQSNFFVTA